MPQQLERLWRIAMAALDDYTVYALARDLLSFPDMQTFKSFLVLAFVLFFGGIFTAGMGLGLFDGVPASFLVTIGVLLAVVAPATALVGASLEEGATAGD